MNESLSTFLKLSITATTIGLLLFGVAYTMLNNEASEYDQAMKSHQVDLP
ncbi:hypothetical protein [Pontibacillus halophilus]|nr:hypothetical protein [Pontibacillus halophilus]